MGTLFVYILKSSVCLAVFYLFYRLLLSRETFHRFNRIALLGILSFSCLLPLVEVSVERPAEVHQTMMTWEQWLLPADVTDASEHVTQVQEPAMVWMQVLLLVYLAGIVFFVFRHFYSLLRLVSLLKCGRAGKIGDYVATADRAVLIIHEREIAPFSWMRYIAISRKDLEENGREILIHELAHIRNRHSWDLLATDVCIFFQWFNPAAWLLKQELQNIHEYEADETVINEGVNAKQYQLLLIKKAVGTRLYSMANSFNHSKLKKRITMMLKEKSSPWARLKYLYVLPVAAIAVTAFARPEVSNATEEISRMSDALGREQVNSLFSRFHDISAVKVNDLTAIVETKVAESVGQPLPRDTVKQKGKAEQHAEKTKVVSVKGKEPVQQLDEMVVVGYASKVGEEDDPVSEMVDQMPSFPGGIRALMEYLATNMRYPVEAQKNKIQGRVIVGFIVGKTGDVRKAHVLHGVDPDLDAEAVRVIESLPKWTPGMLRGKAVAVKYTMPVTFRLTADTPDSKPTDASGALDKGMFLSFKEGKQPLCLVDGKEVDFAIMRALKPESIEHIKVVSDKATLDKEYGEKGKNGVLLIQLKKQDRPHPDKSTDFTDTEDVDIYVDGVKVDTKGKKLEEYIPADKIGQVRVDKTPGQRKAIYIITKK
ncbi:M56 family metallopeptidase [uncultured Bacteroides sp.]|uniref:M56 family metallopeptidase n=1 Tax=uncultured Bacteroides sp. TaxID=162156 RepID=UPI0025E47035|nr:M56 family metallopeptidase [uncultured Bacteroides sp.]